MPIDPHELDRMADLSDAERTIHQSLYCGRCGYNLRYSLYVGRCNECGNPYNARPLSMKGIFLPHELRFPGWDLLVTLACISFGVAVIWGALNPTNDWLLIFGAGLLVLGGVQGRSAIGGIKRYLTFRRVRRRIELDDD